MQKRIVFMALYAVVSLSQQFEVIHYRFKLFVRVLDVENVPILAGFEIVIILAEAEGADFEILVSGQEKCFAKSFVKT